mgnify:CR=1 FL=1
MKPFFSHPFTHLLIRLILGGLFIYAAVNKIADPYQFANDIRNYNLLPYYLINITALFMPWLELYCGLFLIAGLFVRAGSTLIGLMLVVFIMAIISAILRGLDIECGCYGELAIASRVGIKKVIEDVILLVMALYLYLSKTPPWALDHWLKD